MDHQQEVSFPTIIQTSGYSPSALEATAALIFGEQSVARALPNPAVRAGIDSAQPRLWPVEQWNESRDMASVMNLWTQSVSGRFSIDYETLSSLLRRPGYAKHYVVREPRSEEVLGFCATYLSYADQVCLISILDMLLGSEETFQER